MSIYQCAKCGCAENTALGPHIATHMPDLFDWTGLEKWEGKPLCSVCGPTKFADGESTEYGVWHGRWEQIFLPIGEFETGPDGCLRHKRTKLSIKAWRASLPENDK